MAFVELHLSEVIAPRRDITHLRALYPPASFVNVEAIEHGRQLKAERDAPAQTKSDADISQRLERERTELAKRMAKAHDGLNSKNVN